MRILALFIPFPVPVFRDKKLREGQLPRVGDIENGLRLLLRPVLFYGKELYLLNWAVLCDDDRIDPAQQIFIK